MNHGVEWLFSGLQTQTWWRAPAAPCFIYSALAAGIRRGQVGTIPVYALCVEGGVPHACKLTRFTRTSKYSLTGKILCSLLANFELSRECRVNSGNVDFLLLEGCLCRCRGICRDLNIGHRIYQESCSISELGLTDVPSESDVKEHAHEGQQLQGQAASGLFS